MIRTLIAVVATALLAALSLPAFAQDDDAAKQQALLEKYEEKVKESWFTDNGFTDDYDKARELSKSTGKPIFAYFSRSYSP